MTAPEQGPRPVVSMAMERAGVPKIFMTARPASKLLSGAFLFGPVGTGKSLAASGAVRAYVERHIVEIEGEEMYLGKRARFINAPEWFKSLRSAVGDRSVNDAEMFRQCANCGLLVLDDLGKGKQSEWVTEALYVLVNKRWSSKLPTIMTTNLTLDGLCDILPSSDPTMSDALKSRIAAMCKPYEFTGPDKRAAPKGSD